ncbi:nucleotidyltransferase [Candidatus Poribacteria bacterium]|nr:nucleotidyltransferase [Candidatus Poribacteria bacterium]
MALIQELTKKKLIHPPKWLPDNMCYATIMGSQAYGVSDDSSDMDIYGFCMPPKHIIFPHLAGVIIGFGEQGEKFEQFQAVNNVVDPNANGGKGRKYDISIYNIVRYFHLCMHMNPNMVDSLFTPTNCVIHSTKVGEMVRAARRDFLNKKCWHTYKGYAYAQMKKMSSQERTGKRKEVVDEYGFDLKFGYHLVRLMGEVEQILREGDLDLQRDNERLKAIRRGEWTEERIKEYFAEQEKLLEQVYIDSQLPYSPNDVEPKLKNLLLNCLEEHYGSLEGCVVQPDIAVQALRDIRAVIDRVSDLL